MTRNISRRALLPFRQPEPEKAPLEQGRPAFSLAEFYAKRPSPTSSLPMFEVRAPPQPIDTTGVGVTRSAGPPRAMQREPRPRGLPGLGGPVRVVEGSCLAWQGSPCSTCSERCPVEGAISVEGGRPTIDPLRCNGCGDCVAACPAPLGALKLIEPTRPT